MIHSLPRVFYFTFLVVFLSSYNSFSQQIQTYDSTYQAAPGLVGNARFEYYEDREGRKIKHGDFSFTREKIRDTAQTNAVYNYWEGTYSHDIKQGEWLYETKKHRVEINEISDVDLDYTIYTEDEILNLTYNDGFPVDEILLESSLYANKRLQKRLKFFNSEVVNGKIHGDFEFFAANEDEDIVAVNGHVENGLMDGIWEFNYFRDNTQEERTYDNGILLNLLKKENNQVVDEIEFPLSEELQAVLNNEESTAELAGRPLSLTFSDGYPRTSIYIREQQKGEEVLTMILEEIFKYDEDFDISQQLPLGANRGFYPLTSEERSSLSDWAEIEAEYRNNLQQLNNLKVDNLNLVQDSELQLFLGWAEEQEKLEEYIKPWNNILSKEQVEYYNREGLLVDYAHNLLSQDTVSVNDETQIFEYKPEEKGDNFLLYIVENFRDRNRVADSLINEFSDRLETLEINREIADLNTSIKTKKTRLDSLYKNLTGSSLIDRNIRRIKSDFSNNTYPDKFEEFSSAEEISQQIETGEDLLVELEILEEIYNTASDLASRHEEIDQLYTEFTFDPFTFSDQVPVRKKKRLYNYVTEEVIEALVRRAGNNYSEPTTALKDLQLAQQMQERLIFLEDKNTNRLERRLVRSDSLNESVELLNSL